MTSNVFTINDMYIGRVIKSYPETHELEVFIPKLMPTLSRGFTESEYNVGLQSIVLKTNTILCSPIDYKKELPEEGSLVSVYFIDEDIKKIYWRDFDPYGTNTYTKFEKSDFDKKLENLLEFLDVDKEAGFKPNMAEISLGGSDRRFENIYAKKFIGDIDISNIIGFDKYILDFTESINKSVNESLDEISKGNSSIGESLKEYTEEVSEVIGNIEDNINQLSSDISNLTTNTGYYQPNVDWSHSTTTFIGSKKLWSTYIDSTITLGDAYDIEGSKVYNINLIDIAGDLEYLNIKGSIKVGSKYYILGQKYVNLDDETLNGFYASIIREGNSLVLNIANGVEISESTRINIIIECTTQDDKSPK